MTKSEVLKMLKFAEGAFPTFNCKDWQSVVAVWVEMFASEDAEKAMNAMKIACTKSKYFPSIADVKSEMENEKAFWRGYLK